MQADSGGDCSNWMMCSPHSEPEYNVFKLHLCSKSCMTVGNPIHFYFNYNCFLVEFKSCRHFEFELLEEFQ